MSVIKFPYESSEQLAQFQKMVGKSYKVSALSGAKIVDSSGGGLAVITLVEETQEKSTEKKTEKNDA